MNKAKKIICVITLALSALACAGFANAAGYVPLVRIPGLPAAGPVNLSMYMIGLYNFLLSIVGIVAVMMLVFGGMRYITAMGSSTAISSAKDIITNALFGLLLALISWVIVSTINPDILYIKNPTSKLPPSSLTGVRDVACTQSNSPCVCNDLTPLGSAPEDCSRDCRSGNHCAIPPAVSTMCIGIGTSNTGVADDTGTIQCTCVNEVVVAKGAAATCHVACLPANCLVADLQLEATTTINTRQINARYYNTPDNPFVITDLTWFEFDLRVNTVAGNGFASGCIDGIPIPPATLNGLCDAAETLPVGIMASNIFYGWYVAEPLCTTISNPLSVQCPFRYWVFDTAGNTAEDIIWIRILAP